MRGAAADFSPAFTERARQAATLRDIAELTHPFGTELAALITDDRARHAHRHYWRRLKGRPAPW
ncbi:hypothetical protein [Streptomyces tauricus]|uniref:hypothetical protein n=1 Tax=Streptomyces tauricus TaxID=68274 RepID=UPI00343E2B77